MAETQQAMAQSSPHLGRMRSSDSYWMELVSMDTFVAKRLKASGRLGDQNTVRLGSGAGPRLYSVWSVRKADLVTSVRPSSPWPPTTSVTQTGSPEKSWLYSGARRKRTMRHLMTTSSMISCACD